MDDEVRIEDLLSTAVKTHESSAKPRFTYFQVPAKLMSILKRLSLEFSSEDNEDHFKDCPAVQDEREWLINNVNTYFNTEFNQFCQELITAGVRFMPDVRYKSWARKVIISEFQGRKCPREQECICDVLFYLNKSYDLENAKIFLLIRELLNQYLIGLRLDKEIHLRGMFQTITNARGEQLTLPHSGMKSKFDFSELFLKYIQALDEITREGFKFTVEGQLTLPGLMKKIIDSDKIIDVESEAVQIEDKNEQS